MGPQEAVAIERRALWGGSNLEHRDWTWAPKDRVRSKVTPRNLGVGLNKRGKPKRFSRGWKVA